MDLVSFRMYSIRSIRASMAKCYGSTPHTFISSRGVLMPPFRCIRTSMTIGGRTAISAFFLDHQDVHGHH